MLLLRLRRGLVEVIAVAMLVPVGIGATQAGDAVGFPRSMSWEHGQTATFSISGLVSSAEVYQMGTNGQTGQAVAGLSVTNTSQPACLKLPEGSADCGNWSVSASWNIPAAAPSGLYRLVLTPSLLPNAAIWFLVRCDECHAPLLVVTSDATWQAYNTYGGGSLYKGDNFAGDPLKGREFRVSYNRPLIVSASDPTNTELPLLNWLTANGFDFQYVSQLDLEANPAIAVGHRVVMTAGHMEYVSTNQRTAFEYAIANGISWANLTGGEFYWKVDPQPSIDATAQPYRTIVCYKETLANADINPSLTWTGTWRDRRWSPPNDGGRPENALTGQLSTVNDAMREDAVQFTAREGQSPFLRNTPAAQLRPGQVLTMPAGTLGYEWDEVKIDNLPLPSNELALSTSVVSNVSELQPDAVGDYSVIVHGVGMTATHHVTLYQTASGAWVLSTGSVQWSWGLSNDHNNNGQFQAANVVMQQATMNILIDMGLTPTHAQGGVIVSSPQSFALYGGTVVSQPSPPPSQVSIPAVPRPAFQGYWTVSSSGSVYSFGALQYHGGANDKQTVAGVVHIEPTTSEGGYWMLDATGQVMPYGDATFYGSTGSITLKKPIVGMAATPTGKGYWLVASDGGIFAFGDAVFSGSTGATVLNKPIVGMAV